MPCVRSPGVTLLTACLALLLVAPPAPAEDAPWPVASDPPLVHDSAVTWGRLDNGLRYAIMPNRTPPGRVSLRLLIEAGSLMEDEDQRGLAHFVEHMAFKGSANLPPGELARRLQREGLAFGPDTNAATGFHTTTYRLELPRNDPELLGLGLDILSEVAARLTIPAELIEPERGVILSEKRQRDTPGSRSYEATLDFLLPGSRFATRLPIGTEAVIRTAPRQRLVDFYGDFYTPERGVVVVVGEVGAEAVARMIEARFAELVQRPGAPPDPEHPPLGERGLDAMLFSEPGARTAVSLNRVLAYEPRPDGLPAARQRLLESLALGMLGRRLESLALRPGAPFTEARAGVSDLRPAARIASLQLTTTAEDWREALMTGEQELRRALEHGFTPAELEQELLVVRSQLETADASAATRQSAALVRRLVQAIASERIFTAPATELEVLDELAQGLAPADVDATLRALFATAEPQIILTGPIELAEPRAEVLEVYAQSRGQPVAPPEAPVAVAFPYGDWGPPSAVVQREEIADLGITRVTFANGVRLDMKPTPFEADTVHVALRFGTGRLGMPPERPGLDLMAARAFADGGLGRLDRDPLARLMAGRQVGLDLTVADSALVLSGRTTRRDLPLQLDLLAAYVTDAAYRPEAEERYRAQTRATYARLAAVPQGARRGPVALFLHGGDPRFAMPPEAEAEARTLAELEAWLGPMLEAGPLQVAVVGDVEPERIIAEVGRTFGALPARPAVGAPPEAPEIRVPAAAEPVRFTHEGAADRALVMVYWPTTGRDDQRLAIGLELLADMLRDRLFAEARESLGATYSPSAASHASRSLPGYGHIGAAVDVTVAEAERMARLIRDVAAGMQGGGISEDEFRRALEPRLARARTTLDGNDYWLRGVLIGSTQYPERLDEARSWLADHEAQTRAAVQALAERYLDPARALTVLVLPAAATEAARPTPDDAAVIEAE